jgi:hypothetical protein
MKYCGKEFKLAGKRPRGIGKMLKGNLALITLLMGVMVVVGLFMVAGTAGARPFKAAPTYAQDASQAPAQQGITPTPQGSSGVQDIYLRALDAGVYDKPTVKVRANEPVRVHFSADPRAGCGRAFIMRDFGVQLVSRNGEEQVAEFTPKPGKYEYSCSMRMFRGVLEAS